MTRLAVAQRWNLTPAHCEYLKTNVYKLFQNITRFTTYSLYK